MIRIKSKSIQINRLLIIKIIGDYSSSQFPILNKSVFIILFCCSLTSIVPINLNSQTKQAAPITLKYADSLVGMRNDLGNVREFVGNVQFEQGKVKVRSNRAIQYLDQNKAEMLGDVVVTQEDMKLTSPKIFYDGNSGIATSFGEVQIKDKNATLNADAGTYSTKTFIADFFGNVKIVDTTATITSDSLQYNRKTRESKAQGNITIEDDSALIYCDYGEHYSDSKVSNCFQNVIVQGKYSNSIINCDSLHYRALDKYILATGMPVVYQIDTVKSKADTVTTKLNKDSSKTPINDMIIDTTDTSQDSTLTNLFKKDSTEIKLDTLCVSADKIESNRNEVNDNYVFTGNVEIVRSSLFAKSKNAIFNNILEYIILEGKPIVWYDSTQIHSDSLVLFLANKKLKLIDTYGNSIAVSRNDTLNQKYINQISGEEIKLYFNNDTVTKLVSIGNAKTLYFQSSESGGDGGGLARDGSDTVVIYFSESQPDEIFWLGGVTGEYFPEKMFVDNPKEYYLPSFRWSDERPKKKMMRIRSKK